MRYLSAFMPDDDFPADRYMPYSRPTRLTGNGAETVVICLHGFTATVYEAMPVARAVFEAGMDAACPLFPAHGLMDEKEAKKALAAVKYEDWLEAVRNEIAAARKHYKKVFVFGQSMGGAVALRMAEEHLVDACAATAPAIKLPPIYEILIKKLGKYNFNLHMGATHPFFTEAYSFYNSGALLQLLNMAALVRSNLTAVNCPVLACLTPEDNAIDKKRVPGILRDNIPGVTIKWFLGEHCMTLNDNSGEVIAAIAAFFQNYAHSIPFSSSNKSRKAEPAR